MQRALELAKQALWLTSPNPRVGCVITAADGSVLGEGHTQRAGGPHAEVMALRDAAARGHSVQGATAWVTLEPCAHQGRTGPCCDALAAAGIGRVVSAMTDPNPKVAGQGMARLAAAGVQTETLAPGLDEAIEARELNIGFFSRMERGLPWVRMKIAASLDGQTSLQNGQSQWITSEPARTDGHAWRARACAVLTGIGTVLEDNPRLDVRGHDTPRQPHLVIVDSRLETPLDARLFETLGQSDQARQIWIYTAAEEAADPRAALQARGATVIDMPGPGGKVDLAAMLRDLARREVNELHVEAGHKLNGSFIREGLVDEFLVYLAPQLLGPGQGMANLPALTALSGSVKLAFHAVDRVGPDLRLLLRRR
ncbi:riboflavin biosynthesis protein RibD [Limnohabitans sp. MMS-10A-160]|jgi:diaminohydroxyphosphoribosylaminopyrimidine deaminase/5-amino-6-(5-phosphoribosylamino)uracil reductase|uniref:bifunctional diaminohydroxyphosphoribosylaminopyrimidine deaminase/5-amino-6-(5-phosphoribosylamino)uracil reductase RibD n=1 Tax=unclassified Limnohabitans TaxID=2626134 RepID=UPI000D3BF566|nr:MULTISPECIES: bifunctional diaminohydroxyphosphoribosylaminopyrimidine deaminase/5-amino-6-(5-phosphoribosylamino)uracil reductase RibD [unclassified Limnohabitans]PUE16026.1 riboflavin biosynthesis protein RibD [Limnohabitans sp. MMS-10A-192]PUE23736.1 riboflavin biosynthesis protein RibD [Limnohabitans sp. MMS-10A-160]